MEKSVSVDDRIAEWRRRYETGEYLTAAELCTDCPELTEEVERRIDEIERNPIFVTQGVEVNSADATIPETAQPEPAQDTLTFSHRFSKLRFLARGGLGEIYVADDLELQRDVVLKFIRARHRARTECQAQFQLEAEVTAKLDHPGVVPVYGIGRTPDGRACYAMRYIHGVTLDETIAQFHAPRTPRPDGPGARDLSPFSAARASELHNLLMRFVTACKTIAYAHNRGIVHRDLKPDNIMLGKYGETLVVDWGLAMPVDRDDSARASGEETLMPSSGTSSSSGSTGGPVGTPAFMSPEQANGAIVRPASDIFSLGATLYKLLTGHAPYSGESVHEVVTKARYGSFTPPRRFDRRVPRPLAAICEKAMAVDPGQRYITAMELADDLERWLAGEPVTAYHESLSERLARWTLRHRIWTQAILTALVAVSLVVTLAAMMLRKSADSERTARNSAETARTDAELAQKEAVKAQKDALRLSAEFIAKSVGQDLLSRWLILEREAADAELASLVTTPFDDATNDAHDRVKAWLANRKVRYDNSTAPAHAWALFDRLGISRGRSPEGPINTLGKSFLFRDYFHGLGSDIDPKDPNYPTMGIKPIEKPHRSNVFQSQADKHLVVNLTAPIWSLQNGQRQVVGVLSMSLEIGDFQVLKSNLKGRVLRLIDTNSSALKQRGTVLFDSRHDSESLSLQARQAPDALVNELQRLGEQRQAGSLLKEDFVDETDGGTAQRWLAVFEPVVVRTPSGELHDTGWVVVVQQPTAAADKP
jgi:serine/threonine-protein kinase